MLYEGYYVVILTCQYNFVAKLLHPCIVHDRAIPYLIAVSANRVASYRSPSHSVATGLVTLRICMLPQLLSVSVKVAKENLRL